MKKYIIHKEKSKRNISYLIKMLGDVIIFEPLKNDNPINSLTETVLEILKQNQGEDVLIFEDDVVLTKRYNETELINIANSFRGQIDYINTGVLLKEQSVVRGFKQKGLKTCNYYNCTQGVYYLSSAYEKLKNTQKTYIDRMLQLKTKGVITHPFMTVQKQTDDSIHFKKENILELFEISEKDKRWDY